MSVRCKKRTVNTRSPANNVCENAPHRSIKWFSSKLLMTAGDRSSSSSSVSTSMRSGGGDLLGFFFAISKASNSTSAVGGERCQRTILPSQIAQPTVRDGLVSIAVPLRHEFRHEVLNDLQHLLCSRPFALNHEPNNEVSEVKLESQRHTHTLL